MQRRRRKRRTDPAIAALARELLEAGEPLRHTIATRPVEEARLFEARIAAQAGGYAIGVTYCDAIASRRAAFVEAIRARSGPRYAAEMARADRFGAIAAAADAVLRANAGE
jgi:hypothetical protein